jgi:hypothetical protein
MDGMESNLKGEGDCEWGRMEWEDNVGINTDAGVTGIKSELERTHINFHTPLIWQSNSMTEID